MTRILPGKEKGENSRPRVGVRRRSGEPQRARGLEQGGVARMEPAGAWSTAQSLGRLAGTQGSQLLVVYTGLRHGVALSLKSPAKDTLIRVQRFPPHVFPTTWEWTGAKGSWGRCGSLVPRTPTPATSPQGAEKGWRGHWGPEAGEGLTTSRPALPHLCQLSVCRVRSALCVPRTR